MAGAAGDDRGDGEDLGVGHDRDDAVRMPKLADLTTLRLGGPAGALRRGAHRGRGRRGRPRGRLRRRAGARAGRRQQPRRRRRGLPGHRRPRADARRRARRHVVHGAGGRAVGPVRRRARRGGARRDRVPVGHPGIDRRDADPERRRLRAGGRRGDHLGARVRPRGRARSSSSPRSECGFSYRSSAFKREPGRVGRARGHVRARRAAALAPDPLRGAGAHARRRAGRERAARRRARGGAEPAALEGHGDRPGRPGLRLGRLVLHQPDPRPGALRAARGARRRATSGRTRGCRASPSRTGR